MRGLWAQREWGAVKQTAAPPKQLSVLQLLRTRQGPGARAVWEGPAMPTASMYGGSAFRESGPSNEWRSRNKNQCRPGESGMCVDVKPGRVVGGDGLGEGKGSDSDQRQVRAAAGGFECGSEPPGSGEGDPVNDFFFFFFKVREKEILVPWGEGSFT